MPLAGQVVGGQLGVSFPLLEEDLFEAFFAGGLLELGLGGDGAVDGVEGDLVNGFNGLGVLERLGEVAGGDLEGVEEESGAARVDPVEGDAAHDFADGGLDGAAVLGEREVDGGLRGGVSDWLAEVFLRAPGGVVVIAEIFLPDRAAAATVAVGEDVPTLIDGCFDDGIGRHWCEDPPPRCKSVKYSNDVA